ncbi:uncharacterized protein LOC142354812 [Convolutriloba macropyga]|uniref:uncharacterized protein LOC142354812 n=1 Tax=Convolutriloba macropyga TaxID=536237 RepID=UPI003F528096
MGNQMKRDLQITLLFLLFARAASLPKSVREYTHVARVGDDVTLECESAAVSRRSGLLYQPVSGPGRFSGEFGSSTEYNNVTWWTSGKDAETATNITVQRDGIDQSRGGMSDHYSMKNDSSLVIHDLSHSDSGYYTCHTLTGGQSPQHTIDSPEKILLVQGSGANVNGGYGDSFHRLGIGKGVRGSGVFVNGEEGDDVLRLGNRNSSF